MPSLRLAASSLPLILTTLSPVQGGTLDPGFDGDGRLVVNLPGRFWGLAIQSDDRIVAVGSEDIAGGNRRWLIQRYHADGSADLGFGSAGTTNLFGATPAEEAFGVALDGSGRILVAGTSQHGSHLDTTVVRLSAAGLVDTTFGSGGVARVHASSKSTGGSAPRGIAMQVDGKIVLAGYADGKKSVDLSVVRLNAAGALDASFGSGSGMILDALSASLDAPWYGAMALQVDGRILVGAYAGSAGSPTESWYLMRYQASGTLDSTWGTGGRVKGSFAGHSYPRIMGVLVQPDGKVVASGRANHTGGTSGYDYFLARYQANGTLDTSFGGGGFTGSGLLGDDQGSGGVVRQPDGRLVLAGHGESPAGSLVFHTRTMRFSAACSLDPTFGSGGVSEPADLGGSGNGPRAVALDNLGRIVVAGYSGSGTPALARYLGN